MTASRSPALENLDAGGLSWAQESVLLTSAPRVLDSQSSSGRGRGDPDEVYHPIPPRTSRSREAAGGLEALGLVGGATCKRSPTHFFGAVVGAGGGGREETISGWPPSASCD